VAVPTVNGSISRSKWLIWRNNRAPSHHIKSCKGMMASRCDSFCAPGASKFSRQSCVMIRSRCVQQHGSFDSGVEGGSVSS